MSSAHEEIRGVIRRVRARWQLVRALRALFGGAVLATGVLALGLLMAPRADQRPLLLGALGAATAACALGGLAWFLWPLRRGPSPQRVARYIEEREPELDDRLVSAVHVLESGQEAPSLAEPMLADTARRLETLEAGRVVPASDLARSGLMAATAFVALLVLLVVGRERARQAYDAAAFALFPSRVTIEVEPGDARIRVGDPFTIAARIAGSHVPLVPRVDLTVGTTAEGAEMVGAVGEEFRYVLGSVTAPFTYRVSAGGIEAGPFTVDVVSPPRVQRIDVEYEYPRELRLTPRTEEDGGDIYAPEGTTVRVRVHTDRPAESGALELTAGAAIRLDPRDATMLEGELVVRQNDSYRVALAGADGLSSSGDIEYFIRALEDRPPDVRITQPAGDRSVTPLEEVDVEARADDDYGVAAMELVYAIGGSPEHVLPMAIASGQTAASGRQTIYLEDLGVNAGDMLSYYVRARDVARGKRATEARSDIFFLQVRPFEQEFSLAQSQAAASGASDALGDLVNAQKEVVAATWKLDRRAGASAGGRSDQDVHAVARAEEALRTRVEQVASAFGASTMREPRRSSPIGPEPRVAIPARPEEAAMTAASAAMGEAVAALDKLSTTDALPHEMSALDQLLKAQAEARDVQIAMGRGNGGRGNSNYDLSSLFDRELQRSQQTNYETPESSRQADAGDEEARKLLDAIRALAERQDELLKRQRELAAEPLDEAARRRELERLTREQSELREQAEQLARQSERSQSGMRSASEAMQSAANELRRQNPDGAGRSAGRALDALRNLERQLGNGQPGGQRREAGEAQLEARQLADAERRLAGELDALTNPSGSNRAGRANSANDSSSASPDGQQRDEEADRRRRLAAEQERLADRTANLGDHLPEVGQGRLAERMRELADAVRAGESGNAERQAAPRRDPQAAAAGQQTAGSDQQTANAQRDIARALEQAADRLAQAGAPGDEESQRMAAQLAELGQLRERLDEVSREIARLGNEPGGSDRAADLARLKDEYGRQLERAEQALDQLRRERPEREASTGFTFEGQGMTLSAPGTEAFKQDFARWEALRQQADAALARAESSLAGELSARQSANRLAAGLDDRAPRGYQDQVDAYFKALAERDR